MSRVVRFVVDCLELSRNDSRSYPFDLLFDTESESFLKADLDCIGGEKILNFRTFLSFCF